MNKILSYLICFAIILSFSGCKNKQDKEPIKINMPKDNTVNGYKNENINTGDIFNGTEINTDSITVTEKTESYKYFGNTNSKKFHKVSCKSFKNTNKENITYYKTKDEFLKNNYIPCKICNP